MTGLRRLALAGILLLAIALIIDSTEGKKHKRGGDRHKNQENKKEWKEGTEKNARKEGRVSEKGKKEKFIKKERKDQKPPLSEETPTDGDVKIKKEVKQEKKIKQDNPKIVEDRTAAGDSKKVKRSVAEEGKPEKKNKKKEEAAAPEGVPACEGGNTKENYRKPSEDACRKCAEEKAKEEAASFKVDSLAEDEEAFEDTSEIEGEGGEQTIRK